MIFSGICFLMQCCFDTIAVCRTLYHAELAPYWTRRGNLYTLLPDFGRDKSGLRFGREGQ